MLGVAQQMSHDFDGSICAIAINRMPGTEIYQFIHQCSNFVFAL
jgi:hypothetical protein